MPSSAPELMNTELCHLHAAAGHGLHPSPLGVRGVTSCAPHGTQPCPGEQPHPLGTSLRPAATTRLGWVLVQRNKANATCAMHSKHVLRMGEQHFCPKRGREGRLEPPLPHSSPGAWAEPQHEQEGLFRGPQGAETPRADGPGHSSLPALCQQRGLSRLGNPLLN